MRIPIPLLFSLALHGLLLFIPLPDRSPPPPPLQPEATVSLTDLLATPAPSPGPAPLPSVSLPPASSPSRSPIRPLVRTPVPSPLRPPIRPVAPSPSPRPATPQPASPSPTAPAAPATPSPSLSPSPSPDRVETFFEQVAAATGVPTSPPSPQLFADPSLYFASLEPTPTLQPEILRAVWLEGKTPEQVYISVLSSQLQTGNFQTEQKPDYGGGTVYQIKQGDATWYLNLVPTQTGSGTILVVWQRDPSRPGSPPAR